MNAPNLASSKDVPRLSLREGLRSIKDFAADPLAMLSTLAGRGEPLQRLRGIDLSLIMMHDADLIGEVLMNREDHFIKDRFTRDLDALLGQGLLTSEGELWKRQRRMIAPSLSPKHIAGYAECMVRRTEDFVQRLPKNSESDVHNGLMQLTLDIVVETLFGAEIDERDGEVGVLLEHVMEDYVLLVRTWRRLLPRWFPQPVMRRIKRISTTIDGIIERVVRAKMAGDLTDDDLLTRLLVAQSQTESEKDDEHQNGNRELNKNVLAGTDAKQMRDELVTLFTAGHETTALTLAYTLHLVAGRPEIQERIREEIESVAPGRALTSGDAMVGLPFCTAVIRESMRLYPPAWVIGREALRDCQVGPYTIKRREQVLISPYTMHRNSEYFPEPDAFQPERWESRAEDKTNLYDTLPRYVYLPFGGGPRICVGNHFAMMEAVLLLGTMVRSVNFAPPADRSPIKFFPAITLRPVGALNLRVTTRD